MALHSSHRLANFALAGALLAAAACSGGAEQQQAGGERPAPEVAVETVEPETTVLSVDLPGRTSAYRVAEVRPQVSGIIRERLFEEGQEVTEGKPLYRIDAAPYQAAYDNAEAMLSRAQALAVAASNRSDRYAKLVKVKAVGAQDFDDAVASAKQARADVAAARAARDSAKVDLDRTTVPAPISGRIGRSYVTNGALVSAGQAQELAVINALDPIYVDVAHSSTEILRLKRMLNSGALETVDGQRLGVTLTLEDGSVYEQKGKLELTEVSVDPATGSVTLRAVFPNPDGLLLPGMFVRAEIIEGMRANAILAPQKAITRNPQGEGLAYVLDKENKAQARMIETERAVGDRWLVSAGLEKGDRIVVEGFQRFRPGDAVTPVDNAKVADARDSADAAPAPDAGAVR